MVSVEKTELKGERARRWPGGYRAGLRFERSGFETWLESMCSVHGHSTLLYPQTRVAVKCPCNPKKCGGLTLAFYSGEVATFSATNERNRSKWRQ